MTMTPGERARFAGLVTYHMVTAALWAFVSVAVTLVVTVTLLFGACVLLTQ